MGLSSLLPRFTKDHSLFWAAHCGLILAEAGLISHRPKGTLHYITESYRTVPHDNTF
jgi:hypothetical protein